MCDHRFFDFIDYYSNIIQIGLIPNLISSCAFPSRFLFFCKSFVQIILVKKKSLVWEKYTRRYDWDSDQFVQFQFQFFAVPGSRVNLD